MRWRSKPAAVLAATAIVAAPHAPALPAVERGPAVAVAPILGPRSGTVPRLRDLPLSGATAPASVTAAVPALAAELAPRASTPPPAPPAPGAVSSTVVAPPVAGPTAKLTTTLTVSHRGWPTVYRAQAFQAVVIEIDHRAAVALPFSPEKVWGPRGRFVTSGTVAGRAWRGPLEPVGDGRFVALLDPEHPVAVGATVEVVLAAEDPLADNVAPDVAAALRSDPEAREFFEDLAGYYRRNFIRGIEGAKRPETRAARIAEMMALLRQRRREK